MNKRQWKKTGGKIALAQSVSDRIDRYCEQQAHLIQRDMMIYGVGYHRDGKHVPFEDVIDDSDLGKFYYPRTGLVYGVSPIGDLKWNPDASSSSAAPDGS